MAAAHSFCGGLRFRPAPNLIGLLGSITGSLVENEKTLNFSVPTGVRPFIETIPLEKAPLEKAPDAVRRRREGDVKFPMVTTMRGTRHTP